MKKQIQKNTDMPCKSFAHAQEDAIAAENLNRAQKETAAALNAADVMPTAVESRQEKMIEQEANREGLAKKNEKIAMSVSLWSIVVNVILTAFKLIAGILGKSFAMISDAVHSASDVFSTFIVMIGVKIAGKKADVKHPYGHERFECVAAILLAVMLGAAGVMIGWTGIEKIFSGDYAGAQLPGMIALIAAIVSIVVKEGMYWFTIKAAKKIGSGALKADAWHHRSDAISSVGSFAGILFAVLGFPIMDSIASIIICLLILKVAVSIFKESVDKMTDVSCDKEKETRLKELIIAQEGVLGIDGMKTRRFGDRIYMEVEIAADGNLTLSEAHEIADLVHDQIEEKFPEVKHCTVHTNPRTSHQKTDESAGNNGGARRRKGKSGGKQARPQ